jgi:hypothetical protein
VYCPLFAVWCCREWRAQLQVALDAQCVGMLRLETGALKATYTNTLKSAQATIAMLMVVAGRRAAEAAVDKLQAVTRCVCAPTPATCCHQRGIHYCSSRRQWACPVVMSVNIRLLFRARLHHHVLGPALRR